MARRDTSRPTREALSCLQALSDLLEFCLQSSVQEMGPALLGFAPGWNDTKIKETLRDQEMAPPRNWKMLGSLWSREAPHRERD